MIIQLRGLDAILAKLGKLETLKWVRGILEAAAQDVKGGVAVYPPASEANAKRGWQPGGKNTWYERGYGQRWVRKDGSVGGRQTSQTLGRRWTTRVGDTWAKIGNNAGYAMYVQDADHQPWYHKQRGWATIQAEGEKAMEGALKKVEAEIDRIWNE
jgi:phage gpG-like protein